MRILTLFLICAAMACGQSITGQVCFYPDKTVDKKACVDVTPALKQALRAYVDAQTETVNNVVTPKYSGIADLIFSNLFDGLFPAMIDYAKPGNVATAQTALDTAKATLDTRRAAALARAKVADPQ